MRVLAIDTETTGLPPKPGDVWPFIVQFSYVYFDSESNELIEKDHILRVPGDIPTSHIHGITKEMSDSGIDFGETYASFCGYAETADIVIGHNIEFDLSMLQAECKRRALPFELPTVRYCTMRETRELVGIMNPSGSFKYPKLSELYEHLFDEPPQNCHNALSDAYMSMRCFLKVVGKQESDIIRARIHK